MSRPWALTQDHSQELLSSLQHAQEGPCALTPVARLGHLPVPALEANRDEVRRPRGLGVQCRALWLHLASSRGTESPGPGGDWRLHWHFSHGPATLLGDKGAVALWHMHTYTCSSQETCGLPDILTCMYMCVLNIHGHADVFWSSPRDHLVTGAKNSCVAWPLRTGGEDSAESSEAAGEWAHPSSTSTRWGPVSSCVPPSPSTATLPDEPLRPALIWPVPVQLTPPCSPATLTWPTTMLSSLELFLHVACLGQCVK